MANLKQRERACNGPTRRELLRIGSLSPFGLGLIKALQPRAAAASKAKGTAKSAILLFMWGGPSHIDTWDPKPDAPAEVRGAFESIATTIPGLRIGEHFPLLAARAKQYAVVRSMGHTDPAHLSPVHHLLTGHVARKPKSDADGASRADAPCMGAVVKKLLPSDRLVPPAVTLPWVVSHPNARGGNAPGQNAGWLGANYDPFLVTGDPNSPSFAVDGLSHPNDVPTERLKRRADLSHHLDRMGGSSGPFADVQAKALDIILSPAVERAFDLSRESATIRDKYGRHPHGQSTLLARRLIEAGTRLVTVNWPNDRAFWDTHGSVFPSLKNRLMPPADMAFAALLDDLTARGLLDETLVIWVGEFGRTPRVEDGGRQHWPQCYSAVLAGGGIRGGVVFGSSDKIGAYPTDQPVSPADLTATAYHALGIDPAMEIHDSAGRPLQLTYGNPLRQLFA